MRAGSEYSTCCWILILTITTLVACSCAKPLNDTSKIDTELSDLNSTPSKNKTAAIGEEDVNSNSAELTHREFPHRDEDQHQLNTATNMVLARNYKYDVEILESGTDDDEDDDAPSKVELEERFKGHGVYDTDTIVENIEMTPIDVESSAISESHMMLSIVLVVLALVSIGLYAALVIWRSHLDQRYGMRERLVNRDLDDALADDVDYHVAYPHTLSPYAPTTTATTTRA